MQLRDQSDVIQSLQERIHGMERSRLALSERSGISTGFPDLDRLLADGGLRRGTLVEWLGDGEGGRFGGGEFLYCPQPPLGK